MSKAVIIMKDKNPLILSLSFDDETGEFESRLDLDGEPPLQAVACTVSKEDAKQLAEALLRYADS